MKENTAIQELVKELHKEGLRVFLSKTGTYGFFYQHRRKSRCVFRQGLLRYRLLRQLHYRQPKTNRHLLATEQRKLQFLQRLAEMLCATVGPWCSQDYPLHHSGR